MNEDGERAEDAEATALKQRLPPEFQGRAVQ